MEESKDFPLNRKAIIILVLLALAGLALLASSSAVRSRAYGVYTRLRGRATVEQRLAELGPRVRNTLIAQCGEMGVPYPPARLTLLVLKQEGVLQVYAPTATGGTQCIAIYPILGASGSLGPKLREGDRQVPEGLYRIVSLNPNSQFHLSMELDYPNELDRQAAAADGRANLGGDIFIHGGDASVGCVAMGDAVAELLFVGVADAGLENVEVLIAPLDLRLNELPDNLRGAWRDSLYNQIAERMALLPVP